MWRFNHQLPGLSMILILLTGQAAAAESQPPRLFNIELLVFQHLVKSDGGEIWPADYSNWFEETVETLPSASETVEESIQVTWLSADQYTLTAERNALGRSSAYRPLAYLAWRQPVLDREKGRPMMIPAPGNSVASYVDGTVKVAVERYLHLYLDLKLHLPHETIEFETQGTDIPEIRLTEKRRMRSQEIHYFDNPRFGVIALITPYKHADDAAPATEASDNP